MLQNRRLTTSLFCKHTLRSSLECEISIAVEPFRERNINKMNVKPTCHKIYQWRLLCWGLTSQSTIFQSCRDGAIASWVINQYFRGVKCLAQGHNTAEVGLEPRTSRSGVRHSTTEPPRSPYQWRYYLLIFSSYLYIFSIAILTIKHFQCLLAQRSVCGAIGNFVLLNFAPNPCARLDGWKKKKKKKLKLHQLQQITLVLFEV